MNLEELSGRLKGALTEFIDKRFKLLMQDVHEDAISDEFIHYLRRHFDNFPYSINHNYDKRVVNDTIVKKKTAFLLAELPEHKIPKGADLNQENILKEILPDIIFHDIESPNHNLLMVEIKKSTNKNANDRDWDILKLKKATTGDLHYTYSAFIDFTSGTEFNTKFPYKLEIFEAGQLVFEE